VSRAARAPLSLRWRLLLGTAVAVALAAVAAGWALSTLFREHVQRQFADSLVAQLDQVTARLDVDAQGQPVVDTAGLSDPRWSRPYSGLYWQLDRVDGGGIHRAALRSRSLWDAELAAPPDALHDGQVHRHTIAGPGDAVLLAVERTVRLGSDDATWRVLVAGDTAAMRAAIDAFDRVLALSLLGLTLLLVAAAVAQVAIGLAPLRGLRASLQGLHAGRSARLEGRFPAEVQPLVDDFNAVLQRREQIVERSRTQAGNLAHAIKTPLAVMSQAAQAGQGEPAESTRLLAHTVAEQVELARRQVDRHLARARAAGALGMPGLHTEVGPVVDGLLEVMQRLYAARNLRVDARIPSGLVVGSEVQDAQEMIGNLLDNACKWARSQVLVSATLRESGAARAVAIVVDDDGPGIDARSRERALERGERLDETVPGSGLGLAIVRDLAALYEGSLALDASALGGLRATLVLPRGGG